MKDVIFIPARAGSVGVKGKNKKLLNGKPLIDYSVDFAKHYLSSCDIVISTDDSDIFEMYKCDKSVLLNGLRPKNLSGSDVETKDVISYELSLLSEEYLNIWLFQPTCPYREHRTFQACKIFLQGEYSSVVTVKDVGGEHPLRMKRLIGDRLVNYVDTGNENMAPRQSLPKVYLRSGGIYGVSVKFFQKFGELVSDNCAGVVVDELEIINIDTVFDFKLAEILLSKSNVD